MKKIFFTMMISMIAISSMADYYYFEAWSTDDSLKSQHSASTNAIPLMVDLVDATAGESHRFYRVFVTETQYNAGWDALDQAVKDIAKDAAEAYSKDYENWSTELQAVIEVMAEELNINLTQMKTKIRDKKKAPKLKKEKK